MNNTSKGDKVVEVEAIKAAEVEVSKAEKAEALGDAMRYDAEIVAMKASLDDLVAMRSAALAKVYAMGIKRFSWQGNVLTIVPRKGLFFVRGKEKDESDVFSL